MMDINKRPGRGSSRPAPEPSSTELQGLKQAGAALKRARTEKGLSLDQVAMSTRIPRGHLDAIERGDAEALPPGPFAKGFVTAYARHLGLHPDTIHTLLDQPREPEPPPPPPPTPEEGEAPPAPARRRIWPVLLLPLAAVAGYFVWLQVQPPPEAGDGAAPLALADGPVEGGPRADSERVVRGASVEDPEGRRWVVFTDLSREQTPHEVTVSARHRSWVKVTTELGGAPIYEAVLEAGQKETFSSETELWLLLGNAGAVDLTYDGEVLTELGLDGDRQALAFRGP